MNWTWTWSGHCFGYWDGEDLWTHGGKHIGRRKGSEIFSPKGIYIGELMGNGRLVTNKAKAAQRNIVFMPSTVRDAQLPPADQSSLSLYTGFQDFPRADEF